MKVTCNNTSLAAIQDTQLRDHVRESIHQEEIDLVRGRQYHVLGVLFRGGVPWYYICESGESEYPRPYCAAFFGVDDASVPAGWILQWDGRTSHLVPLWWAAMPNFLERLLDGDEEARRVFAHACSALATIHTSSKT